MPAPKGNKFAIANCGGRPTLYDPKYCQELIDFVATGIPPTLNGFAALIGVSRQSLTEWAQTHQEFSEAMTHARTIIVARWEQVHYKNAVYGKGSAAASAFALKNVGRDDWSDKQQIEHSGAVEAKVNYVNPPPHQGSEEDYDTSEE